MSRALPATRRFPVLPVISIALMVGVAVLVFAFILSRVEDEQHRGGPLRNAAPIRMLSSCCSCGRSIRSRRSSRV